MHFGQKSGKYRQAFGWGCTNRIQNGRSVCDSYHVREDVLYKTYVEAIKEITDNAAEVMETIRSGLEEECTGGTQERLHEIEERIIQLQEATLKAHKAKPRKSLVHSGLRGFFAC